MSDIDQGISRIIAKGEKAALVSPASIRASAPSEERTKMLVKADGSIIGSIGGGSVETQVIKEAMKVITKGKPRRVVIGVTAEEERKRGMKSGGKLKFCIDPILSLPTLYIFGGGHISLYIAKIGKLLGFKVVVIDDRPEFANAQRFPEAELILVEDFNKAISKLEIGKSSYIVIATRDHQYDELVLGRVLRTKAKYIGMIRSEHRKRAVFSHLLAKGISQELLDKVNAPIGLEIHAQTLEEIALSVLAEITKVRRSPLREN